MRVWIVDWNVLCRPGSDLLSHVLRQSTIGAEEFNGRVRDGIGFGLLARATRPAKDIGKQEPVVSDGCDVCGLSRLQLSDRVSADRRDGAACLCWRQSRAWVMRTIKPDERLVLVSSTCCHACTPSLSTWWSSTALQGELVLRWVSRLDAFSGYPVRT
jgi:hypothetical protein